jgi:hypothetical protein
VFWVNKLAPCFFYSRLQFNLQNLLCYEFKRLEQWVKTNAGGLMLKAENNKSLNHEHVGMDPLRLPMPTDLPMWALRSAHADDYDAVQDAYRRGTAQITWPDRQALRNWTRHAGWPTPRFGFENAFINQLLADEANFARALAECGIIITIPRQDVAMTAAQRDELDALYAAQSPTGRPTDWSRRCGRSAGR